MSPRVSLLLIQVALGRVSICAGGEMTTHISHLPIKRVTGLTLPAGGSERGNGVRARVRCVSRIKGGGGFESGASSHSGESCRRVTQRAATSEDVGNHLLL